MIAEEVRLINPVSTICLAEFSLQPDVAMTILNVDDDLEDQEIFTEAIGIIDPLITCIKANNGLEGHKLLFNDEKQLSIDYIFLDINMPKMNGIE
jgi:CheY-like chemotaxis protein